ncbi:MAG: amidohydrolase [Defluviitaleaceae bacterium]|nr:amidohydrolase [Defluviitaleaceae bacterium]
MDILFSDITVITMDDARPPVLEHAGVGVENGVIAYIAAKGGSAPDINSPAPSNAARVINGKNKVLIPALHNCHTHTPMTLLRGYADDLTLDDWLFNHIFPAEAKFNDKDMPGIGARLAIAEMISSGTAAFSEMYFGLRAIAEAVAETGVKANLCNPVFAFDRETFDYYKDRSYLETEAVLADFSGPELRGRIKAEAGVHAEYTTYEKAWRQAAEYAASRGLRMQVHLSETKAEHEKCKQTYGVTPAQILYKYGVFDAGGAAAHCAWAEEADMEILARRGMSAVHCPISNLKLACGVAPVARMLEKGVNVALGTDSMASNNSYDLFEEIKMSSLLQKGVSGDPEAIPAYQALKMATANGAAAQDRANESGMIREGLDADLVMLDFHNARHGATYDAVSGAVYSGSGRDVALTMCQGKILYENGEFLTLDIEKVLFEAGKAAERLK